MADLKAKEYQRFEDIKHMTEEGVEFWRARELAKGAVREYSSHSFQNIIEITKAGDFYDFL